MGFSEAARRAHDLRQGQKRPGRADRRGCRGCRQKMLAKMKGAVTTRPAFSLGAVITAYNEPDVGNTVQSLSDSVESARLDVVVVDDGSTDSSCAALKAPVRVLRNSEGQGVGESRNRGTEAALASGAGVVSFHDAHMRFHPGELEAMAHKALESGAVICSKAKGWWYPEGHATKAGKEHEFVAWGCDLYWDSAYGIQPKYRTYDSPKGEWGRVAAPMGACYLMSRETIRKLMGPTGRLWEDIAGRWGFSEQALAVKAFLLGIPVLVSRDLHSHHWYAHGGARHLPGLDRDYWRNVAFASASILSKGTFDLRIRPFCIQHLGPRETDRLAGAARTGLPRGLPWTAQDEARIFTHLCGNKASVERVHPDHAWMSRMPLSAWGPQQPLRIFQWRAGDSTLELKRRFPGASITAMEWNDRRFALWAAALQGIEGVRMIQCSLKDWTDPRAAGVVKGNERFDLITIGGELQRECKAAAEAMLAPRGGIVANPTADSGQLARESADANPKKLEEFLNQRAGKAPGAAGHEQRRKVIELHARKTVTAIILNYKRPENIGAVLDSLAMQTVPVRAMIWDNSGLELLVTDGEGRPRRISDHALVELYVRSSRNLDCAPRWDLARHARADWICMIDDDLVLSDPRVLEAAIAAQEQRCPDGIVGPFGWARIEGKGYKDGLHISGHSTADRRVDVIKGRLMVLPRRLLERVPMLAAGADLGEDDIYVSMAISRGMPGGHLVPAELADRWRQLGREDARSKSLAVGHYERREKAVQAMAAYFQKQGATCR